jgi:hypothetical protein
MRSIARTRLLTSLLILLCPWLRCAGAPGSAANKDVLVFLDGEKLIGQLQRADGESVVFKSDMAGELTVDWKNVEQLHTRQQFVVVRKGTKLVWRGSYPNLTKGEVSATDRNLQIQPAPPAAPSNVAVADTQAVIAESDFDKAVSYRPNFIEDWKGDASLGISLVKATQNSQTYTSSVKLMRLLPVEDWLEPANRTTVAFTSSYGDLSQPGTATVETSIFHASGERDEYFSPAAYVFADAGFDHDFSQGLNLQQSYGGGIGWTAIKSADELLDLKGELNYLDQQFQTSSQNQKLLGSIFSEDFTWKFKHTITLQQQLTLNPAWTNTRAYSATGNVSVTVPVFKRMGVTMSSTDTFLNDPSPGFRKNSFQFTTSLTYAVH